jgi:hypothetical protein
MQKIYLSLLAIIILFTSCKKWQPEYRIVGSWKLTDVRKQRLFNNSSITTGYENGVFTFNDNGSCTYTEGSQVHLNGTWNMYYDYFGYYDSYGNWQNNRHLIFHIKATDFQSNRYLDWEFDETDFRRNSNRLVAFINSASFTYRYDFVKQ